MKEATGELSTTVIAVVAIAAVAAIFVSLILPALRSNLKARAYCSSAVNCTACTDGTKQCYYYEGDDLTNLQGPIACDCSQEG